MRRQAPASSEAIARPEISKLLIFYRRDGAPKGAQTSARQCPEQQSESRVQVAPTGRQEAASAAVGTITDGTMGNARPAAAPTACMGSRRDIQTRLLMLGGSLARSHTLSSSRRAVQTTISSTLELLVVASRRTISPTVVRPSHRFQTLAAVSFRHCARFVSVSYTSVSARALYD